MQDLQAHVILNLSRLGNAGNALRFNFLTLRQLAYHLLTADAKVSYSKFPIVCDLSDKAYLVWWALGTKGNFQVYSTMHNFVFIHVPKTGGNSISKVLLPFSDDMMVSVAPHHDGIDRFEIRSPSLVVHKHSTLQDYRRQISADVFEGLTKVTTVRNPWDRCVSFFFSPHRGPVTWSPDAFEEFISTTVHSHRHFLALDGQSSDPFDGINMVLRFEQLEMDFTMLGERLGLELDLLPRLNTSNQMRDYKEFFPTPRLVELVAAKFAPEIERFNYTF